MSRNPAAVRAPNASGNLPLHLAVASNGERDVESIRFLVRQHPESVRHKDHTGNLPLLLAATAWWGKPDVVRVLAVQWPGALLVKGRDGGRLPVHEVAEELACGDTLRVLAEACPESLLERDDWGRTPLHYAVRTYFWDDEMDYPDRDTSIRCWT